MLSPVFDFGRNWDVLPSFVSRHSNVSLSSRSDSRAYLNLPQSHIKAQTYFTSLSSSFTINLFAKNCQMLTHFLNHVIHGDTPTPSFQGILQPRFSKLSRFENLFVSKWFLIHGDTPTPSFRGDTPTLSFNYKLIIFFLPRFPRICQTNLV
mgnify:CR=1 FL=1